jgi:hypothetical protein
VRKSCPNREEGGDKKSESISKAVLQSKIPNARDQEERSPMDPLQNRPSPRSRSVHCTGKDASGTTYTRRWCSGHVAQCTKTSPIGEAGEWREGTMGSGLSGDRSEGRKTNCLSGL